MGNVHYREDPEYANSRLSDSIVRLGSKAFYVHNVHQGLVEGYFPHNGEGVEGVDLEDLDVNPFKMGYTNYVGKCVYTTRKPARHYKQGLTSRTYHCFAGMGPRFDSAYLAKTINGEYPSIEVCVENIMCNECQSIAFSRNFGLSGQNLEYRGYIVGSWDWNRDMENINFHLLPEVQFLNEELEGAYKC